MKLFHRWRAFLGLSVVLGATRLLAADPAWLDVEKDVSRETGKPQITVVHFWAPWCPNSLTELKNHGWSTFIDSNFDVKFIFVTVRSANDGYGVLAEHGVEKQQNLLRLHHPNHVRSGHGVIASFMDIPLNWAPSTWIFREGKLRYALNYGEVRFPLLQQLVRDTGETWEH